MSKASVIECPRCHNHVKSDEFYECTVKDYSDQDWCNKCTFNLFPRISKSVCKINCIIPVKCLSCQSDVCVDCIWTCNSCKKYFCKKCPKSKCTSCKECNKVYCNDNGQQSCLYVHGCTDHSCTSSDSDDNY